MNTYKIGQSVETAQQQQGIVRYVGQIHVADGTWLGIELPTPTGKNDGSVRGERYFTCPVGHGLFVKDSNIARIVSQPAPKVSAAKPTASGAPTTRAPPASKTAPTSAKSRPSSVIAPKPNPRLSTITKRQSVASIPPSNVAASSRPSVRQSSATLSTRASREPTVDTLQTKLRHLEKQHADDQEFLKDLTHVRDERDRFHGIIQKLQSKCQAQHQECLDLKAQLHTLQSDNDRLNKAQQEHEVDLEDAVVDKEMAEERADVAEIELEQMRAKLEQQDMELDILRSEAELFNESMSEEERQEAGFYRLQHENDRLRTALIALKEMTGERELDLKDRIRELETELEQTESLRSTNTSLQTQVGEVSALIEHLQAQVDANAEWEDISAELTAKNQELEDRVSTQDAIIRDLESLKELNDELEAQRNDEAEDLLSELAAKDIELIEQARTIEDQEGQIAEQLNLITKFRELVFELQGRMADAESSRNMTEAQVKDTTGRFHEVMDLNRRLRTSKVDATSKEIRSAVNLIKADELAEQISIIKETGSIEFISSEPLRAFFAAKRVAAKTSIVAALLLDTEKQLSHGGGLEEAVTRLSCLEAVKHLTFMRSATDRVTSAIAVSPLSDIAKFGPCNDDFLDVERALDAGLEKLKMDDVNFSELADALWRSHSKPKLTLTLTRDILEAFPENEILGRVTTISAYLVYLEGNFAVVSTVLAFLVAHGRDLPNDNDGAASSGEEVAKLAEKVLERLTPSAALCTSAKLASQKLLKTTEALRSDSLYPHILGGQSALIELEANLDKIQQDAVDWSDEALRLVSLAFASNGSFAGLTRNLEVTLSFYMGPELERLGLVATQLNSLVDEASLLINSSEITHGPSPWSQKAKDVEAERMRNAEVSVLSEKLKAEHKTAILLLHERDREIETKNLEIEHEKARSRSAMKLQAELERKMKELEELERDRAHREVKYQADILALEEEKSASSGSQHNRVAVDAPNVATEPVEQPVVWQSVPAGLNSLLAAFQSENHWLRKREHAEVFDRNLRDLSAKMWAARRWEEVMGCSELPELDEFLATPPQAPRNPVATSQFKELPLTLNFAQTAWQPRDDIWLSTIEEDEEEGTLSFAALSEARFGEDTLALEAFSEVQV
ncbi:dynein associated protein-domain-containing protein [Paraphoma chrysanthemicola]|nr:dynein associated protein-domain-containing protein [Paraphoma chrysanthemicola]